MQPPGERVCARNASLPQLRLEVADRRRGRERYQGVEFGGIELLAQAMSGQQQQAAQVIGQLRAVGRRGAGSDEAADALQQPLGVCRRTGVLVIRRNILHSAPPFTAYAGASVSVWAAVFAPSGSGTWSFGAQRPN